MGSALVPNSNATVPVCGLKPFPRRSKLREVPGSKLAAVLWQKLLIMLQLLSEKKEESE